MLSNGNLLFGVLHHCRFLDTVYIRLQVHWFASGKDILTPSRRFVKGAFTVKSCRQQKVVYCEKFTKRNPCIYKFTEKNGILLPISERGWTKIYINFNRSCFRIGCRYYKSSFYCFYCFFAANIILNLAFSPILAWLTCVTVIGNLS